METKYISCNSAISTDVWVKRFIVNLKLVLSKKKKKPIDLFYDNKSTIFLVKKWSRKLKSQTHRYKLSLYTGYNGEGRNKS